KLNRLVITILHSLEIQYARNDGFEVVANPADRVGLDLKQSFYSPRQIASVSNKHRASCDRLEIPDSGRGKAIDAGSPRRSGDIQERLSANDTQEEAIVRGSEELRVS